MVSSTPRPHFNHGKDPVPILQEAGWATGPVWTGGKSLPHRDSIPDRPARSSVAIPTELPGPLWSYKYTHTILLYGVCISCKVKHKNAFIATTKSVLQLPNALCNTAQNIPHVHTFLKIGCYERLRLNRGNMWVRQGVAPCLAG